ncbi:MAG: right-handed parallel beta-helix repeat-containing protein [Anaerolineales bacterium]|nr:right-handed parallel beta-helix repeat-containing protein [Anaerolineales bacterium]
MKRALFGKTILFSALFVFSLGLALPQIASASSLLVNTFDDIDDGLCDPVHCSLREAINAANANPGPDIIEFDVPDGGSNIIHVSSPLPALTDDATTIDATTLSYYAGYPEVFLGKDVEIIDTGLLLASNDNVIRGLGFAGFGLWPYDQYDVAGAIVVTGSGNLIEANAIGLGASWNTNGIYITGPENIVRNNVISGNELGIYTNAPGQVLQGNIIGVAADGATPIHNDVGILLVMGADNTLVGGAEPGEGNLVSASTRNGIISYAEHITLYGNLIGTDITGSYAIPNGSSGLYVMGGYTQIGGGSPGQGNVISGNVSNGIWINDDNNVIQGNHIGTDITGTVLIPNGWSGIESEANPVIIIGGATPNLGNIIMGNHSHGLFIDDFAMGSFIANNIIARNVGCGIALTESVNENTITQNSIYDNGGLGICIHQGGDVTNGDIEPPVLSGGPGTTISGSACPNCLIEFFIADPDPTGFGEGKTYLDLGYADSNGDFSVPLSGIGFCQQITATATYTTSWSTSEFSQNVYANCIQMQPLYLYPLWTFTIVVFGILAWIVRRRRPDSRRAVLIGAAAGGLLFLILIFALPFIRPEFKALPECGNGVIESGETCDGDNLTQCLSGQICKNCRCTTVIEMPICGDGDVDEGEQCDGDDLTLCLSGQTCDNCRCVTHIELCGNGVIDEGEQCDGDDLGMCRDDQVCEGCRCVTVMEAEPPSEGCFYEALSNTNCRQSDYRESDPVAIVAAGESALLVGLNPEYTHGLFELESGDRCWMWFNTLEGPENPLGTCNVQLVNPPEAPTAAVCSPELNDTACSAAGGEWIAGVGCRCP